MRGLKQHTISQLWAFKGELLRNHLINSAIIGGYLIDQEKASLTKLKKLLDNSKLLSDDINDSYILIKSVLILPILFHDIGKAEPHLQKKGTYFMHELYSAYFSIDIFNSHVKHFLRDDKKDYSQYLAAILSLIILNHHQAMRQSYYESKRRADASNHYFHGITNYLRVYEDILEYVQSTTCSKFLSPLARTKSFFISSKNVKKAYENETFREGKESAIKNNLIVEIVKQAFRNADVPTRYFWVLCYYKAIRLLMVADNLVACLARNNQMHLGSFSGRMLSQYGKIQQDIKQELL